jgi:hypothetical protein
VIVKVPPAPPVPVVAVPPAPVVIVEAPPAPAVTVAAPPTEVAPGVPPVTRAAPPALPAVEDVPPKAPKLPKGPYKLQHRGATQSTTKVIDRKKRAVVRAALTSGEELPLEVMLNNMRWAMERARSEEKLLAGVETAQGTAGVVAFRELAQAAAQAAAPYLHSKLAPIVPKGEKGVQVSLIIEGMD